MSIVDYTALGTVFIAILTLIWQVRASVGQSKTQTFLTYTQRYQDIISNLPIGIESHEFSIETLDVSTKEEILRWFRAYFDLCSEEYYLIQNKLIHKQVWVLWESGIKDSLEKPAFQKAWNIIQTNQYFHKEFADYIDTIINSIQSNNK